MIGQLLQAVTMLNLIICAVLLMSGTDFVQGRYIDSPQIYGRFTVHKVVKTWEQAEIQCKSEGAVLASPTTELLNIMRSLIAIHNTPYFIGFKSIDDFGTFTLEEGPFPDNMTATLMEMIDKLDPRHGDCLSMDENKINVVPCCIRLPYICYKDTEHNNNTTEVVTFKTTTDQVWVETTTNAVIKNKTCPSGYQYFSSINGCYKFHTDRKKFADAISICKDEGGNLIVINDSVEAMIIKRNYYLNDYPYTSVGLQDVTGFGEWRAITGEPMSEVYHVWRDGQPTSPRGDIFNCAVLRPQGDLEDLGCEAERDFICEI